MCGHPPRLPAWSRGSEQSSHTATEVLAINAPGHPRDPLPTGIAYLEPSCMSMEHTPASPAQRLSRVQQLTLNSWRLAAAKLAGALDPYSVLEHAVLHATLGALRDVDKPLDLFGRHAEAQPEFALITSLVHATPGRRPGLRHPRHRLPAALERTGLRRHRTRGAAPAAAAFGGPRPGYREVLTKLDPVGSGLVFVDRVEPPAGAFFDLHRQRPNSPRPGPQRTRAEVVSHTTPALSSTPADPAPRRQTNAHPV